MTRTADYRLAWIQRACELGAWVAMFVCLRWVYGIFEYGAHDPSPMFNSDGLYLADLWRDLRSGGRLTDWNLPHATYLIPDLTLWILVDTLTPSIPWAVLMFGLAQVVSVTWLTRRIVVKEFGAWAAPLAPGAWAVVFFITSKERAIEAWAALKPVHHFSIGIAGLLMVMLLARAVETMRWRWWLPLWGLTFGLTLSDPFALSCVWAVLVVILGLVVIRAPGNRIKRALGTAVLLVAGYVGYWLIGKLTNVAGDVGTLKLEGLKPQWEAFMTGVRSMHVTDPIDLVAMVGIFASAPLFIRGVWKLRTPNLLAMIDVLPLTAFVINEAMVMVSGNRFPNIFHRYQNVEYIYLIVTLARLAALATSHRRVRIAAAALAPLIALWLGGEMSKVSKRPREFVFTQYVPDAAKCIASASNRLKFKRGIADFWNARLVTLLNHEGLRVDELYGDGRPRFWLNTTRWFHRTDLPINFILLHYMDPRSVAAHYGMPDEQIVCGEQVVWWYSPEHEGRITTLVDQMGPRP